MANQNSRRTYGVRTNLTKGYLSMQVQLGSGSNFTVSGKPLTFGSILYGIASVMLFATLLMYTNLLSGGFFGIGLFTISYWALAYLLLTRSATLNYRTSYLPVLFKYFRRGGRKVDAGLLDNASRLRKFLGIDNIDPDTGLIGYVDGEVGLAYEVVGNASAMLFSKDESAVLSDARVFYKNTPVSVGVNLITQASSQNVQEQVHNKVNQLHDLELDSVALKDVIRLKGEILEKQVGSKFPMIRQFIMIRGSVQKVRDEQLMLEQAAANSHNLYLKSARRLTNEPLKKDANGAPLNSPLEVERLLSSIYNDYQDTHGEEQPD